MVFRFPVMADIHGSAASSPKSSPGHDFVAAQLVVSVNNGFIFAQMGDAVTPGSELDASSGKEDECAIRN
jgi:hypothetical protein